MTVLNNAGETIPISKIPIFSKPENPTEIVIGETVPVVPDAFQNTKTDPNLELKQKIQELYPSVDALSMDVAIMIHEKLVELHGDAYTERQYKEYVKDHSKE